MKSDVLLAATAAVNFELAALEHDVRVSELTAEEVANLARAALASVTSGWQDISTAPKNRPFLIAIDDEGSIAYHVARYTKSDKPILIISGHFAYDFPGKRYGWQEIQPLPAPPAPEAQP